MPETVFQRLFNVADDSESLSVAYGDVLNELFAAPYWERGSIGNQRVRWTAGAQARIEDAKTFKSRGLYLWGADARPLYIGKTVGRKRPGSFGKRFSRYIWQTRSQCNLAHDYHDSLISSGIDGFPLEIRQWYRKAGNTTVRLEGAVRFAKEGLDQVWFSLLPHDDAAEIGHLEDRLIPIAEKWNQKRNLQSLLNIASNLPRKGQ